LLNIPKTPNRRLVFKGRGIGGCPFLHENKIRWGKKNGIGLFLLS